MSPQKPTFAIFFLKLFKKKILKNKLFTYLLKTVWYQNVFIKKKKKNFFELSVQKESEIFRSRIFSLIWAYFPQYFFDKDT